VILAAQRRAAVQVLALSKMDWNTDALYGSLPATLMYGCSPEL
jgi:hypothetical protein